MMQIESGYGYKIAIKIHTVLNEMPSSFFSHGKPNDNG
jgi:hypothetical protein